MGGRWGGGHFEVKKFPTKQLLICRQQSKQLSDKHVFLKKIVYSVLCLPKLVPVSVNSKGK